MSVSRFFGSTSREAMRQVRLALGAEALIISNRRVNGGVEILATDATSVEAAQAAAKPAVVSSPPSASSTQPPQSPTASVVAANRPESASGLSSGSVARSSTSVSAASPSPASSTNSSTSATSAARQHEFRAALNEQSPAELMSAIGAMRGALESRIDELMWSNQLQKTPETLGLFQSLLAYGFSTPLLRAMLKRMPQGLNERQAFEWARKELDAHLPVLASEDQLWQPGLALALVGPTGVGKTTTIAKLAARAVKRFGPDQVVLITTDTYRIGAHEQLKIYADILRVAIHVVQDIATLRDLMQRIRPDQVVLIDNVGISQRDRYVKDQASLLAASGRRIQRLLALNASSHGDTLDEVARTYKADGGNPLIGCIITKIDEASRLGPALDTAIRYQLPIHYVSDGQKVPENLRFYSAKQLVDLAFLRAPHNAKALYAPTAGDLAALMAEADLSSEATQQQLQAQKQQLVRLVMQSTGVPECDLDSWREQLAHLDDTLVLHDAYQSWQALQNEALTIEQIAEISMDRLRDASLEVQKYAPFALSCYHSVRQPEASVGTGSVMLNHLFTRNGNPLAAVQQQINGSGQWQSSQGAHLLGSKNFVEQVEAAMEALAIQAPNLALVHSMDTVPASFMRVLAALSTDFLAQVSASSAFWHRNGTTTARALAKQLSFTAAQHSSQSLAPQALNLRGANAWVAMEPIVLRQRGQMDLPLQYVCVRITDTQSSALIKEYYFLGAWPQHDFTPPQIASLAMAHLASKQSTRAYAAAWRSVHDSTPESIATNPMLSCHVAATYALAISDVMWSPHKPQLRKTWAQLLKQPNTTLSAPKALTAMQQFFALKEVLV